MFTIIYRIPFPDYLSILFLYSGWFIVFFHKKISYAKACVVIFLTQIAFSVFLIDKADYFTASWISILAGILSGALVGIMMHYTELFIGKRLFGVGSINHKDVSIISPFMSTIVLIAPIIEEIYFRVGIMSWIHHQKVNNVNYKVLFIVLSGLIFVLHHPQAFKSKVIFTQKLLIEGLGLSIVYCLIGNIYLNISAHIVFNLLILKKYYQIGRGAYVENKAS